MHILLVEQAICREGTKTQRLVQKMVALALPWPRHAKPHGPRRCPGVPAAPSHPQRPHTVPRAEMLLATSK